MMDLSDGLGADLPRLARASGLEFEVDEKALPLNRGCTIAQAISDGEDYELLLAISPADARSLPKRWRKKFPDVPLTRIGRLSPEPNPPKADQNPKWTGYAHFQ
jgi:thiamine-monophosphate kinase